jgi:general secretion pathway protein A
VQPLASLKVLADPIYEAFYGLKEQPFAITTDPKFFYLGNAHQRAFSELLNGLRRREGILLVSGETGTGKTTLCRAVIEALGERTFSALILNPYMSGAEVFRIILRDFGLVTHEDLRRGSLANADVPQLLDTLEGFLRSLVPLGTHAVVILDEAQALGPQVLDQIRLLTALEQDGQRLAQIILCGQPGLLTTLKSEPLYALSERITRRVMLAPLEPDEVGLYIQHRLAVAGGAQAVTFLPDATRLIAELSRGLPRRINVLCDRALQEGRIEGVSAITPDLVKRAAKSLAGLHAPVTEKVVPTEPVMRSEPVIHIDPLPAQSAIDPAVTLTDSLLGTAPTAAPRRRAAIIAAAFAGLGLVGAGSYAAYANSIVTRAEVPEAPAPQVPVGAPLLAAPIPSEEEVRAMLDALKAPSVQFPDNRNELD